MNTLPLRALEGKTYIYALFDPETFLIRYIGKTNTPQQRLRSHIAEKKDLYRVHWIQSLIKKGLRPIMQIIEEVDVAIWQERECFWIAVFRYLGCPLTNGTEGGEGTNPTPETRLKMSLTRKQRNRIYPPKPMTDEQRKRHSLLHMGHRVSDTTRAKMSATHKRLGIPDAQQEKMRQTRLSNTTNKKPQRVRKIQKRKPQKHNPKQININEIPKYKICKKCEKEKSISDFYEDIHLNDGHANTCKKCKNDADRKRIRANPERRRLYEQERYLRRKQIT